VIKLVDLRKNSTNGESLSSKDTLNQNVNSGYEANQNIESKDCAKDPVLVRPMVILVKQHAKNQNHKKAEPDFVVHRVRVILQDNEFRAEFANCPIET
jgi:hypothetical protein